MSSEIDRSSFFPKISSQSLSETWACARLQRTLRSRENNDTGMLIRHASRYVKIAKVGIVTRHWPFSCTKQCVLVNPKIRKATIPVDMPSVKIAR